MPTANADAIHRVWDELSDYDASQPELALRRLMVFLASLGNVSNVTWTAGIRMGGVADGEAAPDPLQGWRVAAVKTLNPVAPNKILRAWDRREIDPSFLLPMRDVGMFRTYSFRRELLPAWFEQPFYREQYAVRDVHDAAFVAFPLNESCESHFGLHSRDTVSDETIEALAYTLRGVKWFHRRLMLSQGLLMADMPLTPTEQRVLQLLLTEASEKSIAFQLGIAASTAHQHVVCIFRKFGVRSRVGLMSLWLNRASRPPVADETKTPTD
ncbi:MAG: LuxR family transcriptional regulator [Phenylobacterium sp.]|uniref:helix-turn-helix transcriptional regulator n=1 Tax=Phenylobacterium sp. TaxID=1871053 RepID=UPI0011FE4FB8|nr:helix-turn-helix transcriptional regulator [Phenylobacterium sp.]TAJ69670.1 MAG: LuxR family transcriptional regulator [Phenylobacterium sp.]